MLPLAASGFSESQVRDALLYRYGGNRLEGRFELLDSNRVFKADITDDVIAADVSLNALATVKRTANITLVENDTDYSINYLSDHIRVYIRVLIDYTAPDDAASWAEWPYGTFLLSTPPRDYQGGAITRTIQCYDRTVILTDDKFIDRYTVTRTQKFTDAVKDILLGAGITAVNVVDSSKTLPEDLDWVAGTTRLQAINDLLGRINYYSLSFDELGIAWGRPYVDPASRATDFTHNTSLRTSIVYPDISQELDSYDIPNIVVVASATPDDPNTSFRAVAINSNPASLTSTVSRGRNVVRVENVQVPDQATAQSVADRFLFEGSQIFEAVPFKSTFLPYQELDKISFIDTDLGISDDYIMVSFVCDLNNGGGEMNCRIRKIVTV